MTTPFSMPCRGEVTAPTFNKLNPRELPKFFDELEYLFERADIRWNEYEEEDFYLKRHTLRYVDFETEELWRAIPEFADPVMGYDDFKAGILGLYPDTSEDDRYSLSDIDTLIGERRRLGINSVDDMVDFNTRFLKTTSWLIDRGQLSDLEQRHSYIRAFPPSLLRSILTRLQIKFPRMPRDEPHKISNVYKAVLFVLRSKPASVDRDQYSLSDMDILIGKRLRLGILSEYELTDFHNRFLAITNWLIDRRKLSDLEQQRSYIQAFRPLQLTSILTRLQIKFPHQHPHVPYKVSDVYEAALSVLRFASASVSVKEGAGEHSSLQQTP
jgi:hypothetical protein